MPKLSEASLDVSYPYIEKLIGSITSVKRLTLWQVDYSSEGVYGDSFVFNQLVHLKLHIRKRYSANLLVWMLKELPKLRVLDLQLYGKDVYGTNGVVFWNQPSTVPECMLSSLQTFKFSGYLVGRPEERDLMIYVLKNAHRLENARIYSEDHEFETLDMIRKLVLASLASPECHIVFNW
ncbi:FBD-associated F-box protein At4g10400-like isoform X2 [Eutrema salsugineum]|uniref:FBD-associated F-box protein At4g10400-like isoform X2 n=1 Tax=Eutrema salsugineum TaxID=72664 RepID=UPI000CED7390|nr:FBD-associated F-box protein At4g10400-like isoform X2 [Eutrema salsugineum]